MPDDPIQNREEIISFIQDKIADIENWKKGVQPAPVDIDKVASLLDTKVPKGPSDVTSFHDFHTLMIAFENVWEEVFSEKFHTLGELLYSILDKEKDTQPDQKEIESVEDLKNLLTEAKSLLTQRVALEGVPVNVKKMLGDKITPVIWASLSVEDQVEIISLAMEYMEYSITPASTHENLGAGLGAVAGAVVSGIAEATREANAKQMERIRDKALQIMASSIDDTETAQNHIHLRTVIEDLSQALLEEYAFKVYVPNTVNFGALLTYRQEWDPQTYQVGELLETVPLAPKEVRKYTKKQTFSESRKRKEIKNSLSVRRGESALTKKAEREISERANEKTSFDASASAGGSIGVFNFKGTSKIGADSATESARNKKNFREAVVKSAQELKSEHKLEIDISTESEFEEILTGEISNPNEEITVTYLFYELQRRYKVFEYLREVTPVILVANDVPNPDEIDEAWLLTHEWVLRRFILDDEFLTAFDTLNNSRAAKSLEIEALKTNLQVQLRAYEDTKIELETYTKSRRATERELRMAVDRYAAALEGGDEDFLKSAGERLLPGILSSFTDIFGGGDDDTEAKAKAAEARQNAVEEALARIDQGVSDTRTRLTGIATALEAAMDKYISAIRSRLQYEMALMKLRVHVKENILYYMQAIWDHEPPDQRYFRLCDVEVPTFGNSATVSFDVDEMEINVVPGVGPEYQGPFVTLKEVADLDNLLGYKGNYMMFPLIEDHPITRYMIQDYLDANLNVSDPDDSINTLLQGKTGARIWDGLNSKLEAEVIMPKRLEYQKKIDALEAEAAGAPKEEQGTLEIRLQQLKIQQVEEVANLSNELTAKQTILQKELLANELADEIVVPSDLLFVAALPGTHPVLEDFKLKHRGLDVLKVEAELEKEWVELIRYQARLLGLNFEDPEVNKRIRLEGDVDSVNLDIN